ncbi:hypothetical protein M3Y97_00185200 [Aphelenchoides bicaudatus]|nr:hypothetical protein M3Y97_00185200 [Aphelenchoides bicaudatus]
MFLLFMPLVMVSQIAFAFLTFVVHAAAMFLGPKELEADHDIQMVMQIYPVYFFQISQITLIFGGVVFVIACIQIYFYGVIIRAYGYLQKVRKYPPPLSVGWSHRV